MSAKRTHVGDVLGAWVIVAEAGTDKHGNRKVVAMCRCGVEVVRFVAKLRQNGQLGCRSCTYQKRAKPQAQKVAPQRFTYRTTRGVRLDAEPLLRRLEGVEGSAEVHRQLAQARHLGTIPLESAEDVCDAMGWHPSEVWPDYYTVLWLEGVA